jgi:hypothetical protein
MLTLEKNNISKEELEKTIGEAIKKVHGQKEGDICKYLPASNGNGYVHHFTLRKMKKSDPAALQSLLREFIINAPAPKTLTPKQRAPRGSRKSAKAGVTTFNRQDLSALIDLARKAGYKDIVSKLTPKRSFPSLKRELIRTIKDERVDQELWNLYTEALATPKA